MLAKSMKKTFITGLTLFALSFTSVFSGNTSAFAAEKDVLIPNPDDFEAREIDGVLTITKYTGYDSTVVVPSEINGKPVRALDSTFYNNWSVRTVYLPDTIETIGTNAFASCAVDKVGSYSAPMQPYIAVEEIPDTESCIIETADINTGSTDITPVEIDPATLSDTLPKSLLHIEADAFHTAANLKEIGLPAGIKTIGDRAFINTGISTLTIPAGAKIDSIGTTIFGSNIKTVVVDGDVTQIADSAFATTSNLDSFTVNGTIDEIGAYAFQNSGIHHFTVNGTVKKIGNNAFQGASNLLDFTVNEGGSISELGAYIFYCCGVHEVTLRGNVTSIGEYAFSSSSNIDTVTVLSDTPYTLGQYAFTCAGIHNVNLSDGITNIDVGTFEKCGNLQTVNLPDTLTHISENAFKDVSNIKEITINENVTVAPNAFEGAGGSTLQALANTNNANVKSILGITTPPTTPVVAAPVTPTIAPPSPAPTVAAVKLKSAKVNKKGKKVTLTWTKNKSASGYTIYKKVVKKGTKAKKAKKIKFKTCKNVNNKKTKLTIKLAKKSTTYFYIKAYQKVTVNGKITTVYSKASNTKKAVLK